MWWKLAGLGAIEAALIAVLFWPIKTQTVMIDVPDAGPAHTLHFAPVSVTGLLVPYGLALAAILIPMWIGYRVARAAGRADRVG